MSLRAKTRRRIIIVLASGFILGLGLASAYFIRSEYRERRAKADLAAGLAALQNDDYVAAVQGIGNYLNRHPGDVENYLNYAKARILVISPNNSQFSDTINAYRHVLTVDPSNEIAQRELLKIYQQVRFDVEASNLADTISKNSPNYPAALEAKAIAKERLKKQADALAASEAYNAVAPNDLSGLVITLQILARGKDPATEVVNYANNFYKDKPNDPRAPILQSIACGFAKDTDSAKSYLNRAIQSPLPDAQAVVVLANQCDKLGEVDTSYYDQALTILERESARIDDPARLLAKTLAGRLWQLNKYQELVDHFPTATKDDPEDLLAFRCLSFHALGRKDDASAARLLLTQASRKRPLAKLWGDVIDQITNTDKTDDAAIIKICTAGLGANPSNAYFLYFLAEAYARAGEAEVAILAWTDCSDEAPSWSAPLLRLAELASKSGQFNVAIDDATKACQRAPRDTRAKIALLAAQVAQLQPADRPTGEDLLAQISKFETDNPELSNQTEPLSAEVLFRMGRSSEILPIVQSAIAAADTSASTRPAPATGTYLQFAAISQQAKLGLEQQCLDASVKAHGYTPEIVFASAALQLSTGKSQEGLALIKSAWQSSHADPSDVNWGAIEARYLDQINDPHAKDYWITLANAHPENASVQWMAISSKSVLSDHEFVGTVLDRLKTQFGDKGTNWQLARARWLLIGTPSKADRATAATLLGDVVRAAPDLLQGRLLLANCYYDMQDTASAIEQLTQASRIAPENAEISLQLARILHHQGNYTEAKKYLDRLAQSPSATPAQLKEAAATFADEGDPARAVAILQSIPSPASQPADGTNGRLVLALLYFQTGQTDKLNAICDQLVQLQDARSLGFVAEVYESQNRQADADALLKRIENLPVADDEKKMVIGTHWMRAGQYAKAAQYYHDATILAPSNKFAWQALIESQLQLPPFDPAVASAQAAAKQFPDDAGFTATAAALIDAQPILPQWPELGRLAEALIKSPQYQQIVTNVCKTIRDAQTNHTPEQKLAISIKEFADRNPQFLAVQLLAGRLMLDESLSDLSTAQAQHSLADAGKATSLAMDAANLAKRAMENFPNDPSPAALAAQTYSAAGDWADQRSAADEWKQRAPGVQLAADEMAAAADIHLGNFDEALHLLQQYEPRALADPEHFGDLLYQDASVRLQSGHPDDAANFLRPLLDQSHTVRTAWIRLADMNTPPTEAAWLREVEPHIPADRIDENLLLAEQWDHLVNPTPLAAASSSGARSPSSRPEYRPEAIDHLRKFAEQNGQKTDAHQMLVLGSIQEDLGSKDDAEGCYRAVLKIDPNSIVAENNLAMLLAKSNRLDEALTLATKAAAADTRVRVDCLETLAFVQDLRGQHDIAIKTLNVALHIQADHIPSLIEETNIFLATGQADQARTTFQLIEQLDLEHRPIPDDLRAQLQSLKDAVSHLPS